MSDPLLAEVKALLGEAMQLLEEEHEAHHSKCCPSEDDLCHIGEVLDRIKRIVE